jgi:uncharacterized protein (TIGR03790 family)
MRMETLKKVVLVILLWLWFASLPAWADPQQWTPRRRSPDEVLVVFNANSPISQSIANDYAGQRHVHNVLPVHCQDSALNAANETMTPAAYVEAIENPVRAYLAGHTNIDFIVLTKGIPIRVRNSAAVPSVDSSLAALDYTNLPGATKIRFGGDGAMGFAFSNRYWNVTMPFSHSRFGGYLVTRLDGYMEADAKALVSRALAAEEGLVNSKVLLDVQPLFGLGDKTSQPAPVPLTNISKESPWSEFNADMCGAHDLLVKRGIPDELDLSEAFVGGRSNLLGYFSWGSNDARFSNAAYQTLFFAPGSLSDTAVSTSARTFLPTKGGQTLLIDLIAHGLTCGKGYVDEPLLQAVASPTIALDRYTAGYTMAESFYAASHFVAWEDVIVGDPLCCPFLGKPGAPATVNGVVAGSGQGTMPAEVLGGRWDLTIQQANRAELPAWLELKIDQGQWKANFVGRWGNARPLSDVVVQGNHVHFVSPKEEEDSRNDLVFDGTLAAEALAGSVTGPNGIPWTWAGRRAPVLSAPAAYRWGASRRLFNGSDFSGWTFDNPAKASSWGGGERLPGQQIGRVQYRHKREIPEFQAAR